MHRPARLLIAALLGLAATAAFANDGAVAWQAEQQAHARANAAGQALSDRYTVIWSSLDAAQKARFSAQERAWLNDGRQREQRACIESHGTRTELAVKSCEADVLERHLRALAAPQRVVAAY